MRDNTSGDLAQNVLPVVVSSVYIGVKKLRSVITFVICNLAVSSAKVSACLSFFDWMRAFGD